MNSGPLPPLALTMGDPAGIGGELTVAAWRQRAGTHPFYVVGDPDWLRGLVPDLPVTVISTPAEAPGHFAEALPVFPVPLAAPASPGIPEPRNAAAIIAAIQHAVGHAQAGEAAAVVTNPINKKLLYDGAGFAFPGHTEYLAALAGAPRPVMLLAGPSLKVIPVTTHIPLAEVPGALTEDLIVETGRIAVRGLGRDFGIARPRIAVAGLNPHAGEGGAMGRDEIETVAPAIARLLREGVDARGPLPADTMFHARARETYDVALTMYHDQGLIPIKALDFDEGVNVTLGLPFIRTSPDHGTAYDIAGKGIARPGSLFAALRLAATMAAHRAAAP